MASLPKCEKEALIERVSHAYGSAELMCDGFRVTLRVELYKAMSYRVMVYVNGFWKGEWWNPNKPAPEQKFARRVETFLNRRKEREEILKSAALFGRKGSKERKEWEARADAKFVVIDPTFPSGKAAVNHLLRVCESVTVVAPSPA